MRGRIRALSFFNFPSEVLRYLKAAFWAAPEFPGLGSIPWNVLGVIGFLILGFGHPGFWLLGLSAETAYLLALTRNDRFRRVIDAQSRTALEETATDQRRALVAKLPAASREDLARIEEKCARILQLYEDSQTEDFVADGNREALQKLSWLYLKLLVARQNLQTMDPEATKRTLAAQTERLQSDLAGAKLSPSLRNSKEATLQILRQRLEALSRREETLEEIASDLLRIETQIDLAIDHAGMRGKTETISSNIDLVSRLLDDSVYGDSGASIAALEQTYGGEGL